MREERERSVRLGDRMVVVSSEMGNVTNVLLQWGRNCVRTLEYGYKRLSVLSCFGHVIAVKLVALQSSF